MAAPARELAPTRAASTGDLGTRRADQAGGRTPSSSPWRGTWVLAAGHRIGGRTEFPDFGCGGRGDGRARARVGRIGTSTAPDRAAAVRPGRPRRRGLCARFVTPTAALRPECHAAYSAGSPASRRLCRRRPSPTRLTDSPWRRPGPVCPPEVDLGDAGTVRASARCGDAAQAAAAATMFMCRPSSRQLAVTALAELVGAGAVLARSLHQLDALQQAAPADVADAARGAAAVPTSPARRLFAQPRARSVELLAPDRPPARSGRPPPAAGRTTCVV